MAVGSSDYNVKAELYSFDVDAWKTVDDYPFAIGEGIYAYAIVFIPETKSYFVIGGATGKSGKDRVSHIAKLTNGAWSLAGKLNLARSVSFCLFLN